MSRHNEKSALSIGAVWSSHPAAPTMGLPAKRRTNAAKHAYRSSGAPLRAGATNGATSSFSPCR